MGPGPPTPPRPDLAAALRLMLVTDDDLMAGRDWLAVCRAAESGGATAIQVRSHRLAPRELVELVRSIVASVTVPVLVNDRLDVALAAGAAGVHLGAGDMPVDAARRLAPAGFILGASVGSDSDTATGAGADYWGIGPLRDTTTKADAGPPLGPEGLARLVVEAGGIPCVAIGGVRPEDVAVAADAGASGVAVISGILGRVRGGAVADVAAAAAGYAAAWRDWSHRGPRGC